MSRTMRLRTAKKICKAMENGDDACYTVQQRWRAVNRMDRTKSSRDADRIWHDMMVALGVRGRAEVLAKKAPAMAFGLLMRTPESEWKYGPEEAWPIKLAAR